MAEDATNIQDGADDKAHAAIDHAVDSAKQKADRVEARVDQAADASAQAAHHFVDKAEDWREHGGAAVDNAVDHAEGLLGRAREWVREKPVESVVIALATGWLIGRLLSSRR